MRSIAVSLRRRGETMPGLARLRVLLVGTIIAFQSFELTADDAQLLASPLWLSRDVAVAGLFGLIGFVNAFAAPHQSWRSFALRRLRRAYPALALATLGGIGLGSAITTIGRRAYLISPDTGAYLLNLIGIPIFPLPGVFEQNTAAGIVNAALWTVPVYALVLVVAGVSPRRAAFGIAFPAAICGVTIAVAAAVQFGVISQPDPAGFAAIALGSQGTSAILGGMFGILAARLRARFPHERRIAWAIGLVLAAVAWRGDRGWVDLGLFGAAIAIPAAYLAIYFALMPRSAGLWGWIAPRFLLGVFAFVYPLQQLAAQLGQGTQNGVANLALALPAALLLAVANWYFVERHLAPSPPPPMISGANDAPLYRRARPPIMARLRKLGVVAAVGTVLLIVILAMLAMLFIAMQQD